VNQTSPDYFQMRNFCFYFVGLCLDLADDIIAELVWIEPESEEFLDF